MKTQQTMCVGCLEDVGIHNDDPANCVCRLLGGCRLHDLDDKDNYLFLLFIHYAGSTTFSGSISLMFCPRRDAGSDELEVICKRSHIKIY